jgi:hypothetical protein
MRLLRAIYEKTGGRSRAVRDVAELETGLSAEAAQEAWRHLIGLGLIERFSQDYAARLSPNGMEFIEAGNLPPETPDLPLSQRVVIVHGHGTGARDAVASFLEENSCEVCLVHEDATPGRTIMQQIEAHGDVAFAVVLLTPDALGAAPGASEIRPRMAVLMELGFLIGRLSQDNVCALAIDITTELPPDLAGVALESFDSSDWKASLTSRISGTGPRS